MNPDIPLEIIPSASVEHLAGILFTFQRGPCGRPVAGDRCLGEIAESRPGERNRMATSTLPF
jgi:hypothetical protein